MNTSGHNIIVIVTLFIISIQTFEERKQNTIAYYSNNFDSYPITDDTSNKLRNVLVIYIYSISPKTTYQDDHYDTKIGRCSGKYCQDSSSEDTSTGSSDERIPIATKKWTKHTDRHCVNLCYDAYKKYCVTYKCDTRIRELFRKDCIRNCAAKFD